MFVLGNFLNSLAMIVDSLLQLYLWIIFIRVLLSWVNPDPYNQIVQILYRITEPVLEPIRRAIPMNSVGVDFSPIVVIFAIYFLQGFLVPTIRQFAMMMR